ncbi:long-chain-fatty-acid--CoA ligase 1 [Trichogramma pretiosum]|uniref:long-chain-fatty-acid--CoA ligase 1 n=1 Tax=Trichogramma pretiosum TaxID=7493 RepID=UPI0006C94A00|nr:long-chain-fatty-acid--CoA ligase 1 [Trichogramma pretiosum]
MNGCIFQESIRVPIDINEQSTLLKTSEPIRVSKFYTESKHGKFISYLYEDTKTLYDAFRKGAKESNNGRCLGWRNGPNEPYQWLHYNETLLRANNFGSGLISLGLSPLNHSFVGIHSRNCIEWILTEQACYSYSLVLVPLNDMLGIEASAFIISQAEINIMVCEDDTKCNAILEKAPRCLQKIIVIRETTNITKRKAKRKGIELIKFSDVEQLGTRENYSEIPPKPNDLCTVCYTLGTTGNPKGVMLTHKNIISSISAVLLQLGEYKPSSKDTMLSFLPLAHMLERCSVNGMFMVGGSVGFYGGNMKQLSEDMKALKPTILITVPRFLNRMFNEVRLQLNNSLLKRTIYNLALRAKENDLKKCIIRKNSLWDWLIFKKIQKNIGNNLRLMLVGSAPLAGNILTFARCALGCLIVEGYGQTECSSPITLTVQGDTSTDHVGPPIASCCIKLVDVPEMEYFSINNQGEICVKGVNVFIGYFKDPEKTAETIDALGWHHTGDIGMWLNNGTLKIIDRKKHSFKLSQGEYILPEKIENTYLKSQYVHQIFVHGESLKSFIVAIVVPNVDVLKTWAATNNINGTLSVLCSRVEIKKLILDDILLQGSNDKLKPFEQVKDIYLHPDPFSVQNGLLTTAHKMKRLQLRAYFKPQLEDLYQQSKKESH